MLSSNIVRTLHVTALLTVSAVAFGAEDHVVLNTMNEELQRNFEVLKQKADPAPYFLSYEITDQDTHTRQRQSRRAELHRHRRIIAISTSPSGWAIRSWIISAGCAASGSSSLPALRS